MQITFFSFIMSLIWFNFYIIIINIFRKNDNFIISFSGVPLVFFLFLSILRLLLNFEIPGSIIIKSEKVFTKCYDFMITPLKLKQFNVNLLQLLIFIWILGVIVLLFNAIKEYIMFKKTLGNLNKQQTKQTEQILRKILVENKINEKIEIIQNENISSPFITGILRGKIYIPNINFSEKELMFIILHEKNHFIGKDSLKKIVIQSIKYLFWWNPLTSLFASDFNQILEIQCDLKTTVNFSNKEKTNYLESITKIIKKSMDNKVKDINYIMSPNFVKIDEVDSLKQRFRIVLNYKPKKNIFKILNFVLCFLALILYISSYSIIMQPDYKPSKHEIYNKTNDDNSFIIQNSEGSYDIYIDSLFKYSIKNLEDLDENLSNLPIMKRSRLK